MDVFFANRVSDYEEHMRQDLEGDEALYAYTAAQLPMSENCTILDLGCGTGLELEEYFRLNPTAQVTGIDLCAPMLEVLRRKFQKQHVQLIRGSYLEIPLGNIQYDAAVSVESLHHFTQEQKLTLYEKLWHALRPGSFFILTDYFADTPEEEHDFAQHLADLRREQNMSDGVLCHYDIPFTVEHEMDVLRRAGFVDVERLRQGRTTDTLRAVRQR